MAKKKTDETLAKPAGKAARIGNKAVMSPAERGGNGVEALLTTPAVQSYIHIFSNPAENKEAFRQLVQWLDKMKSEKLVLVDEEKYPIEVQRLVRALERVLVTVRVGRFLADREMITHAEFGVVLDRLNAIAADSHRLHRDVYFEYRAANNKLNRLRRQQRDQRRQAGQRKSKWNKAAQSKASGPSCNNGAGGGTQSSGGATKKKDNGDGSKAGKRPAGSEAVIQI